MGYKASAYTKGNSTFVKADDVKAGPQKFTIESVEAAETPEKKPCLQLVFVGGKKLTLNKTNTKILAMMIGDDTDAWIGKKLIVKFDPTVSYAGKMIGGLRVEVLSVAPARQPGDEDPDFA